MAAPNSSVGSFASTKLKLNDVVNEDLKKVKIRWKITETTCFFKKRMIISTKVAAPNSSAGSFASTKLILNDAVNEDLKKFTNFGEITETTCFL